MEENAKVHSFECFDFIEGQFVPADFSFKADAKVWAFSKMVNEWEVIPAFWIEDNLYEICASPFFTTGVSLGDVVSISSQYSMPIINKVVEPGDYDTFWILGYNIDWLALAYAFAEKKCVYEQYSENYFALSVPKHQAKSVIEFLEKGSKIGMWQYNLGHIEI